MQGARFTHHAPQAVEQVLDLLSRFRASVRVLAGGTDLLPRVRTGRVDTDHVVGLGRVKGIRQLSYLDEDGLVIGAGVKVAEAAEHEDARRYYPALAQALAGLATPQVRNQATVVGNLASRLPYAESAPVLLALGASLVVVERGGRRQVKLEDFLAQTGEGVVEPMEFIEAIRVPAPPERTGTAYLRLATAPGQPPLVSVAGRLNLSLDGEIIGARLVLMGLGPAPLRVTGAEDMLVGQSPAPEVLARAGAAAVRSVQPQDDERASANYRRRLVQTLTSRALEACVRAAGEGSHE